MNLTKKIKAIKKRVWKTLHLDYRNYDGIILPSPETRSMNRAFDDDKYYFNSSVHESKRLVNRMGVNHDSEILELGSATGRMIIGLMHNIGSVKRYVGIDVNRDHLAWCRHFIGRKHKCCHFLHMDLQHDRYNKNGTIRLDDSFSMPFNNNEFDIAYANSVFSNSTDEHIRAIAREFFRILKPGGAAFVTAFIEEDVPPMEINPANYLLDSTQPLHVVRFEKNYFLSLFTDNGFIVEVYEQGVEVDGQSGIYLRKPGL